MPHRTHKPPSATSWTVPLLLLAVIVVITATAGTGLLIGAWSS